MITFQVTDQNIKMIGATPIGNMMVAGTFGEYVCQFMFDATWNGYVKTAVFMVMDEHDHNEEHGKRYSVILDENNQCTIDSRALVEKGRMKIGVYGTTATTSRPTIWSPMYLIRAGALPNNPLTLEENNIYAQVLRQYAQIVEVLDNVESKFNDYLPLSGGELTGALILSGDPNEDNEAATKHYVDNILEQKVEDLPVAKEENAGLVKSSMQTNQIHVEEDGTMTINELNVNKIEQDEDDILVLDCSVEI